MKGVKMNMSATMVVVLVICMCAGSVVSQDECCKQCQVICCGKGQGPPNMTCFLQCIKGCSVGCDYSCCFYETCSMSLALFNIS